MLRLLGSNVLRLRLLHCLCYPEFSLGNKASNPNVAAIMLQYQASEKLSLKIFLVSFQQCILTIHALMNSSFWFDTLNLEWPIV